MENLNFSTLAIRVSASKNFGDWTGWDESLIAQSLRRYELQRLQALLPSVDIEIIDDSGMVGSSAQVRIDGEAVPVDDATTWGGTISRYIDEFWNEFCNRLSDEQLAELGMRRVGEMQEGQQ